MNDLFHTARFAAAAWVGVVRQPYGSTCRILRVLAGGGLAACARRVWFYYRSYTSLARGYARWVDCFGSLTATDGRAIQAGLGRLTCTPLVSVIMPTYNPPLQYLRQAVASVRAQLYPRWELCIADDASTDPQVRPALEQLAGTDSRIRVAFREANGHIAAASNTAVGMATGEFLAFLDQDDALPPHALYMVAEELGRRPDADIIYSDEDKIGLNNRRFGPYFKPAWNRELARSQNLVSHLGIYRTALVRAVGGFRVGFEGSQDYDLLLRCAERTTAERIRHIPDVLYHWRTVPGSTARGAGAKPYAYEAGARALREHLARVGSPADVFPADWPGIYRVRYRVPNPPPAVSVVLVTPTGPSARSDRPATAYPAERVEWLAAAAPPRGGAAARNRAAAAAGGELLCFLDGALTPADPRWLTEMVGLALQPDVGAVGAMRLSADGRVTHGGYVVTDDQPTADPCSGIPAGVPGPNGVCVTPRDCAAVSGACLVVRREVFARAGGFDAENFPGVCHDIDFCLRIGQAGYRVVWTPHARFTEPAYFDPTARLALSGDGEEAAKAFRRRWAGQTRPERFFSSHYSLRRVDFSLALPPPVRRPWQAPAGPDPEAA